MFFLVALSIATHLYVGSRLVPALPAAWGAVLAAWLVASSLLMPLGLFARRFTRPPTSDTLSWAGMLCMGLFSSLLVLTFARDVLMLLALLAQSASMGALKSWTAQAVPLAALAITAVGFRNARRTARCVNVDVAIATLPAPLHGLRIVQISDIHVGPTIRAGYLQAIVDAVNALRPDVVAITGDLVDGSVSELGAQVAPLAQLSARHGVFFVTGNHEYYSGAVPWIAELRRLCIRVLMNEHVVLDHGGARFVLAGIPDYSAGNFDASHRPDPLAALRGAPDGVPRILLAHQPRAATGAADAGFDLQLSGHTHGGQFLPWNFFVRLQQPWTAGLHRVGGMWLYVSRGTGYWGPPKRFGAPSEISNIQLVGAPLPAA